MAKKKLSAFEARLNAANFRTSRAVRVFETAIQELDDAADAQDVLAGEITEEIERLTVLRDRADRAVEDNVSIADRMRGIIA